MAKKEKMTMSNNITIDQDTTALSSDIAPKAPMMASTLLQAYSPEPGTDYRDDKIQLVINYLSEAKYKELSSHGALRADQLYLTDVI